MAIGYLLGGIGCIIYFIFVGYLGGIKSDPTMLRLIKMKFRREDMKDETATKLCLVFGFLIGELGIFLLIFGYFVS